MSAICQVSAATQAELKGCHHGIYSFGGHFSKAGTLISLQIGIWQGCQISRLFHEDAQGAQVIYLSILPG
jgi:hypothetical protein